MVDVQEVKSDLIIFRRTDVKHRNWYCRIKIPGRDAYKVISLKTAEISAARDKALEHDADLRFRLKHGIPIFNKAFAQVAADFAAFQKERAEAGQITMHRWRVIDSHIRTQLNRYVGSVQITLIGSDRWEHYPIWRQKNGKGRSGGLVSDGTIRDEMATFRSVMAYAASRKLIPESQIFKGKLPVSKVAREEFTPEEYRALHTYARSWIKAARSPFHAWYRAMAYNFVLVMTNTGMRPSEAKNLCWRDVAMRADKHGRKFVMLNVRGKGKFRSLVATTNVAEYLERIRTISKATGKDDAVFSNDKGTPALTLYHGLIESLFTKSKLLYSSAGSRRSTYCFRHTYATFRLSEGVDSLFLAHQMGTSVKMIEDHYGHITPVKNAERILQGMPGWVSASEVSGETLAGVNARPPDDAGASDSP
ncbi:MAG: site-specific integrase [Caulobacter sp.]|nr:site-specific integrase [Caulobacter sp.]